MPLAIQRSVFAERLRARYRLSVDEANAVAAMIDRVESVKPHTDLVRQGERNGHALVLIDGYACCYKLGAHGERQILAFGLPGDMIELGSAVLPVADHSIASLSRCRIARIGHAAVLDLFTRHPPIMRAFWAATLVEGAMAQEWLMNVGRREGYARVAHLFCELRMRMNAIGRCAGYSFEFPATQIDLADATSMTPIHMNRILQRMRAEGLLSLRGHCITIHDWNRLCAVGDFDPAYLHLEDEAPAAPAVLTLVERSLR